MDKRAEYEAITEMSQTPGWKIIEEMLKYDEKFATSLLTRPRPEKISVNERGERTRVEPEGWITDGHDLGRARGVLSTAKKYLDKVNMARERINKD